MPTIPEALEAYAIRSIEKFLRDGGLGSRVIEQGANEAAEITDEDWVSVHMLQAIPDPSRATRWAGRYLFQITCWSKTANLRADGNASYPWVLAGKVRKLLQPSTGTGITISQWGGDSAEIAWMQIPRIEQQYLDANSVSVSAGSVPSTPSNLHAVALTCRGVLVV
jgi:hypothetical protein